MTIPSLTEFLKAYEECDENAEILCFNTVIAEKMEVDFAGKTFEITGPLTGEIYIAVVFVAILPYSQYIYAEGMLSAKELQWIEVNNHALAYFGGVPALVICDNCRQVVIANEDWITTQAISEKETVLTTEDILLCTTGCFRDRTNHTCSRDRCHSWA